MLQPAETAAPGSTEDKRDLVEDPEKLQRTVFVGNLPLATKRKALTKLFSQYGTVQSVRLRSVPVKPDLKMPRKAAILSGNLSETRGIANAYIVFESTEAADAALAQNMQELGGLHVRVDRAAKKSIGGSTAGVEYDRSRSVFVGNLPFDIEDEELIRLFNDRSDELGMEDAVSAVRVVRDSQSHLGKGFAFVLLKTRAAARAALSLDGQEVRKRAIRVTRVQAAAKAAKKPASAVRTGSSSGQRQPGAPAARGHKRPMPDSDEWRGIRTKGRAKVVIFAVVLIERGNITGAFASANSFGRACTATPQRRKQQDDRLAKASYTQQPPWCRSPNQKPRPPF
ncbi:hypothetical protein WJX72_006275 [[Myrmecia] bisecta]|uniref:RRM domain-containing protein n=1 Tax=[Myrmecia] bisecta TaxID=41462 RepID=A0AAW1PWF1_9CHLO